MIKKRRSETNLKNDQSETDQKRRSKKERLETDLRTIKERTIGNRSEQSHDHYLTIRGKDK